MDIQISNVFETRRGKRYFNIENYKYNEFRVLKSGDLLFRCTNRKCTSRVTVNESITRVINTSNEHNHEAHTDQVISREIIRSSLKRKANDDWHILPSKLIRRDLQNMEDISLNVTHTDMKLFRRSIYDIRRKHFPNLPTSTEIAIEQLNEMQNKIQYKGEQFCFMNDDKNIIIFTCKINLEAISNTEHVFGDGTFTYASTFFTQLYTLHIYKNYYYIPLVYCFLCNKQTSTYLMLWIC
jgi:hypothetical protein